MLGFVGFVVVCCVCILIGYYYAKYRYEAAANTNAEEQRLHVELLRQEEEARRSASLLAQDVHDEVDDLFNQRRQYEQQLNSSVLDLDQQLDAMENASMNTRRSPEELIIALEQAQTELRLSREQEHAREQLLQDTIAQLNDVRQRFNEMINLGTNQITNSFQPSLFAAAPIEAAPNEVAQLQTENNRLTQFIQKLEETIKRLMQQCTLLSTTNDAQLKTIEGLQSDNSKLSTRLNTILEAMSDESTTVSNTSSSNAGLTFFNS